MSDKALKSLVGALAIVVVLWAVATLLSRGGEGGEQVSAVVADALADIDPAGVTEIRILRPTDTIDISRTGDSWQVNGFRADSGSVARVFEALDQVQVASLAASNPANHERMGVSADSARTLELHVGSDVRSVLFGRDGPRASTIYARLPGEDDVYLLEAPLRGHLQRRLDDWRNRRLAAIDTARVTRIEVERDGSAYTVVRADTAWTFADGGALQAERVQGIVGELGGGLVASAFVPDDDPLADTEEGGVTRAYSETGELLADVSIGSGAGDRWGMIAGDSVRYRLAGFRVDLITPSLRAMRPPS